MESIVLGIVLLGLAVLAPRLILGVLPEQSKPNFARASLALRALLGLGALWAFASTSYVFIGADQVGHLRKVYLGGDLRDGRVIAGEGEKGFQATILSPGFHFSPFLGVINKIDVLPVVTIPPGFYGKIETADGRALDAGEVIAQPWDDAQTDLMLNAEYFLNHGGQKGLQTTVLKPGTYRLNLYLYKVTVVTPEGTTIYDRNGVNGDAGMPIPAITQNMAGQQPVAASRRATAVVSIPAGHVGVVKSNITERGKTCRPIKAENAEALSVPLVEPGCRGVWTTPLYPGAYYLSRDAYEVTLVDTRVQTWQYRGGYTRRTSQLTVDQQGNIKVDVTAKDEPFDPKEDADKAVSLKVEGWDVPQELRAVVQVIPENAPFVVASVGGLREIEDRILTPTIRSITRNIAGGTITFDEVDDKLGATRKVTRPTKVLDLIENRVILEQNIEQAMRTEGRKAGVEIREVRLGEPAIPPELMVARLREQLAQQLQKAYEQERQAQVERQKTEQARATADQQKDLVTAQIGVKVAQQNEERRQAEGRAERKYLEEIAAGQEAQANVLGKDQVLTITLAKEVLQTFKDKPELAGMISKLVPNTVVTGGGSSLEGMAAVFGAFNKPEAVKADAKR